MTYRHLGWIASEISRKKLEQKEKLGKKKKKKDQKSKQKTRAECW